MMYHSLFFMLDAPSKMAHAVMLMPCVWEVTGTNLNLETEYTDFFMVFLSTSRKML
jgi:hypothetical protein